MLVLQVNQVNGGVVFAFYVPPDAGPNVGGSLSRVYPGGMFKGLGYERLRDLGTGRHDIVLDEKGTTEAGAEPVPASEWVRRFEQFRWSLFAHEVGAYTERDVLDVAREVIRAEGGRGDQEGTGRQ